MTFSKNLFLADYFHINQNMTPHDFFYKKHTLTFGVYYFHINQNMTHGDFFYKNTLTFGVYYFHINQNMTHSDFLNNISGIFFPHKSKHDQQQFFLKLFPNK